ncbi:MAG: DUF6677 family protein [Acidobacteriota bacterium]
MTRSPILPCIVAWLLPGAGHVLIGRRLSGVVFAVVIGVTFVAGLSMSGTVYALDFEQPLSFLATAADVGVGPVELWARHETFGEVRFWMPDSKVDPKMRERVLRHTRRRVKEQGHAYGRTFLLTAGLMNLLLILDVFDRCIGRKPLGIVAAAPESPSPGKAG